MKSQVTRMASADSSLFSINNLLHFNGIKRSDSPIQSLVKHLHRFQSLEKLNSVIKLKKKSNFLNIQPFFILRRIFWGGRISHFENKAKLD